MAVLINQQAFEKLVSIYGKIVAKDARMAKRQEKIDAAKEQIAKLHKKIHEFEEAMAVDHNERAELVDAQERETFRARTDFFILNPRFDELDSAGKHREFHDRFLLKLANRVGEEL